MKNWYKISLLLVFAMCILVIIRSHATDSKIVSNSDKGFTYLLPGIAKDSSTVETVIRPKNIIVFIADGMGFGHLSMALNSQKTMSLKEIWHAFDIKGWHNTRSFAGRITDSGASATAMATGSVTLNRVIGLDHEGHRVKNVFEKAWDHQYATGIVTDSYIWDATPAAFVAHTESRDNAEDILRQMAASKLDVLFGELNDLGKDDIPDFHTTIDILKQRFSILDESLLLNGQDSKGIPVAAVFDQDQLQDLSSNPNLTKLTDIALQYLVARDKPFLLLIESEEMDGASHKNDTEKMIKGINSIQKTLSLLHNFSEKNGQTLLLFTADHETAGLNSVALEDNDLQTKVIWATTEHTGSVVPLLASGPGEDYFTNVHENWQIGVLLKQLIASN